MGKTLKVKEFTSGYNGGKETCGTWQRIINEIRPHDIFISACLGHCAIARRMRKADMIYGIDIDPDVISAWSDMNWDWITLLTGDAITEVNNLIRAIKPTEKVCIYADPTYRMSSIKSDNKPYKYTMDDSWHEAFLKNILRWSELTNVDILVSHYPDSMYDTWLKDWRKETYQSRTRQGVAKENLYMNYTHTTGELHDYRWIGENKDERYNLKHRTAKNLIAKLERMEPRKKQAVIHYMKEYLS